jgi:hypothetical protein
VKTTISFRELSSAVVAEVSVESEDKEQAMTEAKSLFEVAQNYALQKSMRRQK